MCSDNSVTQNCKRDNSTRPLWPLRLVGVVVLAAAAVAVTAAQQPAPRFQSGVEMVVLDVSVLDRDRRPVRGLKAADFTAFEDGQPQKITSFEAIDIEDPVPPVPPAPWVREVAPDVQKNTDVNDKRLVVVVLDDATPTPPPDVLHARALAREVVNSLGPGDLAAVVYTLHKRDGQPFTRDRSRLIAAVDRFNAATDAAVAMGREIDAVPSRTFFDSFNVMAGTLYLSLVDTLRGLIGSLATIPDRRKALVLIGVGMPFDGEAVMTDSSGLARQISAELNECYREAQRANVNVYPFDSGGLRAPYDAAVVSVDPGNPGKLNRDFLKTVADNTGGFAVTDTNDAVPGIQQALRENASYYMLGYVPANTRAAGRYRKIEVRVTTPGVTVRTRSGYFESSPPARKATGRPLPAASATALEGLLPKTDLTMHLSALPLPAQGKKKATLAIVIGLIQRSPRRATAAVQEIDLRIEAYSPDGVRRAIRKQTVPVTLKRPGGGGLVGYELLSSLELDPGRYHLRAAAESRVGGVTPRPGVPAVGLFDPEEDLRPRSGSVYTDVDIPDFLDAPLSLSGLAVIMRPAPVSGPPKAFARLFPDAPTTVREFYGDDQVAGLIRISQKAAAPAVPVTLTLHLANSRGTTIQEGTEQIPAAAFGTSHIAEHSFEIPVATLQPGEYLLTVTASVGNASATRQLRYTKLR
jgi:VWFA-related protein